MKILFENSLLSCQGTSVAVDDYANFNREILGNESIIMSKTQKSLSKVCNFKHSPLTIEYFDKKYKLYFYENYNDVKDIIEKENVDMMYMLTGGRVFDDGELKNFGIKTCVHGVFKIPPHGEVFATISDWLSKEYDNKYPYVPHMINLPDIKDNLREKLNIPKDATVIGRHGSATTFNLPFAFDAVNKIVKERDDIYFVFLNTNKDCEISRNYRLLEHERIIHLPVTFDVIEKTKFINTCDAMLHARVNGESFGISPGEFSIKNKPVITWTAKDYRNIYRYKPDNAHIEILGEKGIYYDGFSDLYEILKNFYPQPEKDWDAYSEIYNPKSVMEKFKKVFIDK